MNPSPIGCAKQELDTPALCIDLDVMETNIDKMMSFIGGNDKHWRPHEKCHKTPAIALKQIGAGALGVTCAKVSEAEVMASAGVRDILIANMIVGKTKWERLASLCRWADPIVACDNLAQVGPLAEICQNAGVECRVILEVDIGLHRVGVAPGEPSLQLARAIDQLNGVRLAGIMGYEGHLLQVDDLDEKRQRINEDLSLLVECRDMLKNDGLNCDIVSCGGTGSYQISSEFDGITELQAGGGIFADPMYREKCALEGLDYSLSVLCTVVSRPTPEKAVLDAGRKTHFADFTPSVVKGHNDATLERVSAEHCEIKLGPESQQLKIGDKIELIPGYADFTTVMHDNFYGFRSERLEVVWPILARGKLQ